MNKVQSCDDKHAGLIKDFDDVQAYCMFVGHPRSGHSLVGALLDAHPEIVLAHELNALRFVQEGCNRKQLFFRLWRRSQHFTRAGRRWHGYKYYVPNQWHGRYRKLKVIGDKKGGVSTSVLGQNLDLLKLLREAVGVPVKIIQVIRNPFDNIRTLSRWHCGNRLDRAIKDYFDRCSAIQRIRPRVNSDDWLDIYHEDVIAAPDRVLTMACQFLGVEAAPDYLRDCASIVFKEPRRRRFEIEWTHSQRGAVEENIARYSYLSRYSYNS